MGWQWCEVVQVCQTVTLRDSVSDEKVGHVLPVLVPGHLQQVLQADVGTVQAVRADLSPAVF